MAAERRTSRKRTGESGGAERANPPRTEAAADRLPDGDTILFRHLGDQVAPGRPPGWWWQVEYHDGRDFPCGLAWVCVPPPSVPDRREYVVADLIWFVLVADDSRRQGVATRLVRACKERWPDVRLTPPTSTAGRRLCAKFADPVEPEDVINPQAIKRMRAEGMSRADIRKLARGQWDGPNPLLEPPAGSPNSNDRRAGRKGEAED